MNWRFRKGEDPEHDNLIFRKLGVQSMGNIFFKTRMNVDRRMRFAREGEEIKKDMKGEARAVTKEVPHAVTKVNRTQHVFYSGELTVVIKEADTADKLGLDFEIDFVFERVFPVRSVLRLADSAAFLTSMVEKIVNNRTATKPAEAYIGGKAVEKNRQQLIHDIESDRIFSEKILNELGLDITAVSLRDVSMLPEQRRLLELAVRAEKEGDARVTAADRDMQAQMKRNSADADRIGRVVKPAAENNRTVRVREAEAYERNTTVTTYAPGASKMVPLP
jgi:hypothetical protein